MPHSNPALEMDVWLQTDVVVLAAQEYLRPPCRGF